MTSKRISPDEMRTLVGKELPPSSWQLIDQARINAFADVTGDHQFIHVDEERAKKGPFGGTVAHGLLTLSLLPAMVEEVMPVLENVTTAINYGYNKIRFLTPVRCGKRVRAKFVVSEFTEQSPGRFQKISTVTVEIEGEEKPALVAEWIGIALVGNTLSGAKK